MRRVAGHDRRGELAVGGPRQIVRDHPPPPEVLAPLGIGAVPEQQGHQRRADFFPGPQHQVRKLLAGDDPQAALGVAGERCRPLPRPADGQDQPAAGHLQVVIGECLIGAPSARRRQAKPGVGRQDLFQRLIEIGPAGIALVVLEQEFALRLALELDVDGLDVREQRAWASCRRS